MDTHKTLDSDSVLKDKSQSIAVEDVETSKTMTDFDNDAALGTKQETDMPLKKAFLYYRKAAIWSILISMATIMESYDMQLISSFYAFPQFNKKYGKRLPNGTYQVDANWQLGLSFSTLAGLIFGVFASGYLSDRFGPRYVMMAAHVVLTGLITITFTAPNIATLFAGELLW